MYGPVNAQQKELRLPTEERFFLHEAVSSISQPSSCVNGGEYMYTEHEFCQFSANTENILVGQNEAMEWNTTLLDEILASHFDFVSSSHNKFDKRYFIRHLLLCNAFILGNH